MNLYHIHQDVCDGYDTYSDAVVAAETVEIIHPATNDDLPVRP